MSHPLFTSSVIHWWRATHSFTLSGYTFDHRKPGSFLNLIMQSAPGLDLGNSWYESSENTFGYKASQSSIGVVVWRMWHGVLGYCFCFFSHQAKLICLSFQLIFGLWSINQSCPRMILCLCIFPSMNCIFSTCPPMKSRILVVYWKDLLAFMVPSTFWNTMGLCIFW